MAVISEDDLGTENSVSDSEKADVVSSSSKNIQAPISIAKQRTFVNGASRSSPNRRNANLALSRH